MSVLGSNKVSEFLSCIRCESVCPLVLSKAQSFSCVLGLRVSVLWFKVSGPAVLGADMRPIK